MLFSNSYRKLERWIIGFVSLIGPRLPLELSLCTSTDKGGLLVDCPLSAARLLPVIMSVLGGGRHASQHIPPLRSDPEQAVEPRGR